MKSKDEYIVCAAIWYLDEKLHIHQPKNVNAGFVLCGLRHHNCIATAKITMDLNTTTFSHIQGFLTSHNRFVDRKEAFKIAKQNKQIIKKHSPDDVLLSEDIY